MEEKKILEGNKLIADFMGYYFQTDKFYSRSPGKGNWFKEAKYNRSWDWLMPVIEKISLVPLIGAEWHADTCHPITFNMPTEEGKRIFRFKGYGLHEADTLIEAAWMAVVEVVEHLSSNQLP